MPDVLKEAKAIQERLKSGVRVAPNTNISVGGGYYPISVSYSINSRVNIEVGGGGSGCKLLGIQLKVKLN